jgi:hypothetical protein
LTVVALTAANSVVSYDRVWYRKLSGVLAKGVQTTIWPVLQPRSISIMHCVVAVTNVSMGLSVTIVMTMVT